MLNLRVKQAQVLDVAPGVHIFLEIALLKLVI